MRIPTAKSGSWSRSRGASTGCSLAPVTEQSETTEGLRRLGIPIVLIDRRVGSPMGFDCVLIDNHGGARRAIDYLVGLGHRRIGLISGPLESTPGRERHEGAMSGLRRRASSSRRT